MRRRRVSLLLLGVLALLVAGFFAFRGPNATPVPDASPVADSTSAAQPPPLAAPDRPAPPTRESATGPASDPPAPAPTTSTSTSTLATLEGVIVRAENGLPIPFAKVSLSFRETGDRAGKTAVIEADRDGRFTTTIETDQPVPLWDGWCQDDKFCFRRSAADGATDDPPRIEAKPGQTVRVTIALAEWMKISGIVVDEDGRPLKGARVDLFRPGANANPMGSMMGHETTASGTFHIVCFAHADEVLDAAMATAASEARVWLGRRPPRTFDLRKLTESERAEWRIVLPDGRTIRGRLIDESGQPLASVTVSASFADPNALCAARTDVDGRFTMEHVGDGDATIGAYAPASELEIRRPMAISADIADLVLVAKPMDLSRTPGAINVMGLRLADIDEEMRKTRDPKDAARVVIVDPGIVGGFFGMGRIEAGMGIWMIGHSRVVDVKHLIDLVLAESEATRAQAHPMIRIVTTQGRGKNAFTNTQHFGVDPLEMERLKRVRASMR